MKIIKGNIFASECQTIVNTINCVGVMGKGIAYEFKLRYPDMFVKYLEFCKTGKIDIGSLYLYKEHNRWILNFPTKYHWRYESQPEYLEKGLKKFVETYQEKGITSIAFPLLGTSNGGISEATSLEIMQRHLQQCEIPVEIYYYDDLAFDDLFIDFKKTWHSISITHLSKLSGLRIDFVYKVNEALKRDDIRSLSKLLTVKGIGDVTLEKAFNFTNTYKESNNQLSLI